MLHFGKPVMGLFQIHVIKNLTLHQSPVLHHILCLCHFMQGVCSGSNFSLQALHSTICIMFDQNLFDLKCELPHLLLLWTFILLLVHDRSNLMRLLLYSYALSLWTIKLILFK